MSKINLSTANLHVRPIYLRLLIVSLFVLGMVTVSKLDFARAGNLDAVSATLTNSRMSYKGEGQATGVGETTIDITEATPSLTSGNLTDPIKVGDTLVFFDQDPDLEVIVTEIVDSDTIRVDTTGVDSAAAESFYLKETTDLDLGFTTSNFVVGDGTFGGGYFRVLIPAAASDGADGAPDSGTFDATATDAGNFTITCSGTSHTTGSSGISKGASVYSGNYHVYFCNYTGGAADTAISMAISLTASDDQAIVNPAQGSDHTVGTADTYSVIIEHMDGNDTTTTPNMHTEFATHDDIVVDTTTVKVGIIEAVKISATVVPSLTFTIYGIDITPGAGDYDTATACGQSLSVTSYADEVAFGDLSLSSFSYAANALKVTTNAADGAAVTAVANDQPGLEGASCSGDDDLDSTTNYECIWDANVTDMSHTAAQDWSSSLTTGSSANRGFGYSLEAITGTDANMVFEYDDPTNTFLAKHFADAESSQDPQSLFDTNSDPTNAAAAYVCYRIVPDATTAAGDYYNYITYTATPTF